MYESEVALQSELNAQKVCVECVYGSCYLAVVVVAVAAFRHMLNHIVVDALVEE